MWPVSFLSHCNLYDKCSQTRCSCLRLGSLETVWGRHLCVSFREVRKSGLREDCHCTCGSADQMGRAGAGMAFVSLNQLVTGCGLLPGRGYNCGWRQLLGSHQQPVCAAAGETRGTTCHSKENLGEEHWPRLRYEDWQIALFLLYTVLVLLSVSST